MSSSKIYCATYELEIPIAAESRDEAKEVLSRYLRDILSEIYDYHFDISEDGAWSYFGKEEVWGEFLTEDGEHLYMVGDIVQYMKEQKKIQEDKEYAENAQMKLEFI
jgi:hypothetical protein